MHPMISPLKILAIVICLHSSAFAAMYSIDNPADKIKTPAEKMYNPAIDIKNPASNIYNPAVRMVDPNPLSPPTQTVPEPIVVKTAPIPEQPVVKPTPRIPIKNYDFKTVNQYINAIKKAFTKDDYVEFLSLTEDALRRIKKGTLNAPQKIKLKLKKFSDFGYVLLEQPNE
jgi:hypothetical protein